MNALDRIEERVRWANGHWSPRMEEIRAGDDEALAQVRAVVEAAQETYRQYRLWAEDANDGEFAIWREDDFMAALHQNGVALAAAGIGVERG